MTVARILDKKGHRVFTIAADVNVRDVVRELARHRIGVLVVTDSQGQPVGIVSERDVIRELAQDDSFMDKPVTAVMTRSLCKCSLDDTEGEVMALMSRAGVRHLPVEHAGKLVGLVSTRDILDLRVEKLDAMMKDIMGEVARRV